jgi:hypothetical protein
MEEPAPTTTSLPAIPLNLTPSKTMKELEKKYDLCFENWNSEYIMGDENGKALVFDLVFSLISQDDRNILLATQNKIDFTKTCIRILNNLFKTDDINKWIEAQEEIMLHCKEEAEKEKVEKAEACQDFTEYIANETVKYLQESFGTTGKQDFIEKILKKIPDKSIKNEILTKFNNKFKDTEETTTEAIIKLIRNKESLFTKNEERAIFKAQVDDLILSLKGYVNQLEQ